MTSGHATAIRSVHDSRAMELADAAEAVLVDFCRITDINRDWLAGPPARLDLAIKRMREVLL